MMDTYASHSDFEHKELEDYTAKQMVLSNEKLPNGGGKGGVLKGLLKYAVEQRK